VSLVEHLAILPVVLPLATGGALLLVNERRLALKSAISIAAAAALVAVAIALVMLVDGSGALVYRLGNWDAPFGIVLAADRLAALMVLLASVLGFSALLFSLARWHRAGPRFHVLMQFLLMGVNGAFLTGDLFNLFVFFEVLLAASYGLALHGSGTGRVRAGLHYITVNLVASLIFLIGVSLLYGITGTLNMADLALRMQSVTEDDRALLEAGAAILGVAFLVKAGMWPLCFWLTPVYSAASAPAAAMFAVLTKVGVYVVMRTWLLFFGEEAGASAGFGGELLLIGGMATLAFGTIGVLASQDLSRLASYSLLVSAGTLLAAVAMASVAVTSAALYYLIGSTLGAGALYLLIDLIERERAPGADILALTAEAFVEPQDTLEQEEEIGIAIPAAMAVLGASFACCALMLAGLPPLAGFIGKFALLDALLNADRVPAVSWVMLGLLMVSGLAATLSLARAGVRRFWASAEAYVPRVRIIEIAPIVLLLASCAALTIEAGAVMRYLEAASATLHQPRGYIERVLSPP
jgi:multicomponent K+:H+ antiporter subunit D